MMDQPIMKCIYSEEQLKEQFKLLEYVDYLQAKLAAAEAALRHDVDKIEAAYIDEMQTLREENARLKAINHTMNSDYCKEDARLRAICDDLTAKLALAVEAAHAYTNAMRVALEHGRFPDKSEVSRRIERILTKANARETLEKLSK